MKYAEIEWRKDQPYSREYDDIYYSQAGGRGESEYVFIKQNDLPARWRGAARFVVAETGFGTGLNFILTLKAWSAYAEEGATLHYIGVEKHPVSPDDIRRLAASHPDLAIYFEALLSVYMLPVEGVHTRTLLDGSVYLHLHFMDVVDALSNQRFDVDAWYLDGFGPAKNPDLWNDTVFGLLARNSKPGTSLSTYTCAGSVRRGLHEAGFEVTKTPGHGKKREMITATLGCSVSDQSEAPWYEVEPPVVSGKTVAVIGAGLAGLSVAWSFVQRGWQVTIVDKYKDAAQEASGNPAGLVMPRLSIDNKNDSMFYSSAFLYAINQLDKLQSLSKQRFWFNDGIFSLYKKGSAGAIIEKHGYPESYIKHLTGEDVPEYFKPGSRDVCYFPNAGWSSPEKICRAIEKACSDNLERVTAKISAIKRVKDKWELVDKQGESRGDASIVVVANGTGVEGIDVTSYLPVSAVRGQMTEVSCSSKSARLTHALSFDAYVTPAHDGVHYVGASYSANETTTSLLDIDQDENMSRLEEVLPGVFDRPLELTGRVGFRPVSTDRVPVVGAVPDVEEFGRVYKDLHHGKPARYYERGRYQPGLYVSAAHGSRGMCSCFLSAEIIASMAENSPLPVNKEIQDMLSPARFLIRSLKRSRHQDR
jgi:tRNA 5-methylaminomethyl-2-thiouridine biosynthesis bifunctional protein